jgi:ABC-type multidrug transport system permease subunit
MTEPRAPAVVARRESAAAVATAASGGVSRLERSAIWQLSLARMFAFLREPEAVFWVFAFPVLLALALGIAFRNQGPQRARVGIEARAAGTPLARSLSNSPDLEVVVLEPDEATRALRRGRIAVLVVQDGRGAPLLRYDPSRPETRLAYLATADALQRGAGRSEPMALRADTTVLPGNRYIDFLIPGLIGLNLLGTGMWGIGFPIASARQQKLLKRLLATPMRKSDYLLSFMFARLVWLLLEVAVVVGFGWLAFGVKVNGSWLGFAALTMIGAFAFSALGLLVASRAQTIEGVSGLMNLAMLPMWLLSGTFFSAERFPAFMQPVVQALPLTAVNNGLRAIMNEGAGFAAIAPDLLVVIAWGLVSFFLALRVFRWE